MWWLGGVLTVALAAVEMPYDGIDQDLDGFDLVDVDGDGDRVGVRNDAALLHDVREWLTLEVLHDVVEMRPGA